MARLRNFQAYRTEDTPDYISEEPEEIRKAAQNYALALMHNVQMVTGVQIMPKKEGEK